MGLKNHIMNFKTYNLFLDDVRMPSDCLAYMTEPRFGTREWVIVRSHDEFVNTVLSQWNDGQFPELVSFDHDLADEHYDPAMYHGTENYNEVAKSFVEKTGLDSAKFFVDFCIQVSIQLPECLVHSMNPAGRDRIKETLKDYDRYIKRFGSN
jgi:hypothetical protein